MKTALLAVEPRKVTCWKVGAAPELRLVGMQTRRIDVPPVAKLAMGACEACGLLQDGRIGCWSTGGLPIGIAALSKRRRGVDFSLSQSTLCTLQSDGAVRCTTPGRAAKTFANVSEIHGGGFATCFLKNDGFLACLDDNATDAPKPVPIATVRSVSIGAERACAQTLNGAVYCWGENTYGAAVPHSAYFRVLEPTRIGAFGSSWNVEVHSTVTCMVSSDGDRRCWGRCDGLPALPRLSCEPLRERHFPGWRRLEIRVRLSSGVLRPPSE